MHGVPTEQLLQSTCRKDLLFHLTKIKGRRSRAKYVRGHYTDIVTVVGRESRDCEITSVSSVITSHSSGAL